MTEMGLKVTPNPSTSLFHAALRRFCKIDAKIIRGDDVPKEVQAITPKEFLRDFRSMGIDEWTEEWTREYWVLSPLK
jgi:hypothetical protein